MSERTKFQIKTGLVYLAVMLGVIAIAWSAANHESVQNEKAARRLSEATARLEAIQQRNEDQRRTNIETCKATNKVRLDFLSSLDDQLRRSKLALDARLASATSSPLEKATAQRNYDQSAAFLANLHKHADPLKCEG